MALGTVRYTWNDDAGPAMRQGMADGLNAAAERLYALAVPLTPRLTGDLERGYGIHQVTRQTVEQGAQLQNSSPYATRQHEELGWSHTADPHPNAQAKFVEQPLHEHEQELLAIVALHIRQAMGT
jgi:hypothetical protein